MRKQQFPEKKLIVEGTTDLFAIAELRNSSGINDNFDIVVLGTVTNLETEVSVRLKSSELNTLGIIVDADENINKIWEEIKKIFRQKSIILPESIPVNGLIINEDSIRIGVWIMPDNNLNGTLEDFIKCLIPDEDLLIDNHIENIENKSLQRYNSNNQTKAKIHSWLALQESPGTPIGRAINYKYFKINNPECDAFMDWLKKLFN